MTDRSEFDATAHQRAKLQELFPGRKFSEIVHSLNSIDAALYLDPTHVAQKVVRMFGAPISQFERAERHQAAEYQQQQQHTAATQWIGQVVQSGALPGLERPEVGAEVANVLEQINAQGLRTGNGE